LLLLLFLGKSVTVQGKKMTDEWLSEIARRQPISIIIMEQPCFYDMIIIIIIVFREERDGTRQEDDR
jgi:hypothetical protein